MKMTKRVIVVVSIFCVALLLGLLIYLFYGQKMIVLFGKWIGTLSLTRPTPAATISPTAALQCLDETKEIATYKIKAKNEDGKFVGNVAEISVTDNKTGKVIATFNIDDITTSIFAVEPQKCGVYVIRGKNFNDFMGFYDDNEVWKYDYNGQGKMILSSEEFKKSALSLKVDSSETFIALNNYADFPDSSSIVIKNLKTKEDVFTIRLKDLIAKYNLPSLPVELLGWGTEETGENLMFDFIVPGAPWGYDVSANVKIYTGTWEVKVIRRGDKDFVD